MSAILRGLTAVKKATSASFGTADAGSIFHLLSAVDLNFRNRLLMQKSSCLCLSGCLFVEPRCQEESHDRISVEAWLASGMVSKSAARPLNGQSQNCLHTAHAKFGTSFVLMLLQIWILLAKTKFVRWA